MPTVVTKIKSYTGDYSFIYVNGGSGSFDSFGSTFTTPTAGSYVMDSLDCYLNKVGSPTGTATVSLYAYTGTLGSTAVPTGSALGTSGTFDVSTLTTTSTLHTFTFSGANRYALGSSTSYYVTVDYSGGDTSNYIVVATRSAVSGQNSAEYLVGTGWLADTSVIGKFNIYGAYTAAAIQGISTVQGASSIQF